VRWRNYGWGFQFHWNGGFPWGYLLADGFQLTLQRSKKSGWPQVFFRRNAWRKAGESIS
jgi:hypothetical protein